MKTVIATIKADDSGEGHTKFTDSFLCDNDLYRADVLRDVLMDVLAAYNKARKGCGWEPVALSETTDAEAK
jgi:hypothetical protein